MHDIIRLMPNIFLAVIILVIGLFLAKKAKQLAFKMVRRFSAHATLNNLLISVIHIFLVGIVLFTTLSILKLDKAVTSILAGAGIIGLALAFAFQDIAANFISGVFISFRKPFHVGNIVKLKDYMGKVEAINLRDTVLRTFQGQMVILPNKDVFQNPIENFSLLGKRRLDLDIGVSYAEDLEKVRVVTLEAVKDLPGRTRQDEISLFYIAFGESSINFTVRIWLDTPEQPEYLSSSSEAIIRIKKAYDMHGITIPFPIRTLDFDIKGGKNLREMMNEK